MATVLKPLRKLSAPQVVQKKYFPPSPKRKHPRVGQNGIQKPRKPVKRLNLLLAYNSLSPVPVIQPAALNNQSESTEDDGGFPSSAFDTGMIDDVPEEIEVDSEFDLAESIFEIEARQALQLPDYRYLLLQNPESYVRLTARCYVVQDWSSKHKVLSVRVRPLWQR
jgi:hypothetical protein